MIQMRSCMPSIETQWAIIATEGDRYSVVVLGTYMHLRIVPFICQPDKKLIIIIVPFNFSHHCCLTHTHFGCHIQPLETRSVVECFPFSLFAHKRSSLMVIWMIFMAVDDRTVTASENGMPQPRYVSIWLIQSTAVGRAHTR